MYLLTSATMFKFSSVIRHAISIMWHVSISRPVDLEDQHKENYYHRNCWAKPNIFKNNTLNELQWNWRTLEAYFVRLLFKKCIFEKSLSFKRVVHFSVKKDHVIIMHDLCKSDLNKVLMWYRLLITYQSCPT